MFIENWVLAIIYDPGRGRMNTRYSGSYKHMMPPASDSCQLGVHACQVLHLTV